MTTYRTTTPTIRAHRVGYVEALSDVLAKIETDGLVGALQWIGDNTDNDEERHTADRLRRMEGNTP